MIGAMIPASDTRSEFEWMDEPAVQSPPERPLYPPSERLVSVLRKLAERPGQWARISTHQTKNAARVACWRWRRRFQTHQIDPPVEAKVQELYPGAREPFAVVMRQ